MPRVIAIDTETYYDTECTVKKFGPWAYSRHPDFYCFLISVCDGETSWAGAPEEFDWSCLEGAHLISHNAMFDRCVIEAMVEKGQIPAFKWAQWDCTADLSSYVCNRRSLADAMLFLYGEEVSKKERSDMQGKHWRNVQGDERERFLRYADKDAINCWRIWNDFSDRWPEHERQIARVHRDAGIRGVQIDTVKLDCYIDGLSKLLFNVEAKLPWVAEGERPTSTKMIAEMCRQAGIPAMPVKKHAGEEAFQEWVDRYAPRFSWIEAVSNWRQVNKLLGFFQTVKERLDSSGVLHFTLKYFGAHTGRLSGDSGISLHNLRKDPLLVDRDGNPRISDADIKEYWELHDRGEVPEWLGSTNWGLTGDNGDSLPAIWEHSYDVRSIFIAREGYKLVMCDLCQIEPRVLAWLSGNERLLQALREGFSVYEAAAVSTGKYSGPKGGFKKLKDVYKVQKAQTLGLGYGCGWEKYISVAMTLAGYDVCALDPINPKTGKPIYGFTARRDVADFRARNPEITALWKQMDDALKGAVDADCYVQLPSGRTLCYRKVRREERKRKRNVYNEETGELVSSTIRKEIVLTAELDGKRYEFYGGLLVENATQAAAYDVFGLEILNALAGLKATNADKPSFLLWSVHDEGVFEVPIDTPVEVVEKGMSMTPDWLPGCPIGAEAKESPHYLK